MEKIISWVEIPAENFERAVNFYNAVFNLNLEGMDFGKEKMACFPSGEGAISFAPGFKPSKNGVIVSLNAGKNMEVILEKIVQNGGSVVQPKTKIEAEGRGWFALFSDTEGNRMGLYGE